MKGHTLASWTLITLMVVALASVAWAGNVINVTTPVSGTLFNPWNGEPVNFTGSCHTVINETLDSSGGVHFGFHVNCHVSAVGQDTGARYIGNAEANFTANVNSGETVTLTFPFTFSGISKGSEPNFVIHSIFHITINPDGTVTSFVDTFSAERRG
jgi:hypothetical protein